MHTHTNTYTKHPRKGMRSRLNVVPTIQSKGMATDIEDTQQFANTQRLLFFQLYRFLFSRPLVLQSIVMEEGYIRMERNHQFVNKYNPVILYTIKQKYNLAFIELKPLSFIFIF
jgi:hypothetical protein